MHTVEQMHELAIAAGWRYTHNTLTASGNEFERHYRDQVGNPHWINVKEQTVSFGFWILANNKPA